MKTLPPAQIRAARALVGMSQDDLAAATGLSPQTIKRAEKEGDRIVSGAALSIMRDALEAAGVIFLAEGEARDGGLGVRLRR